MENKIEQVEKKVEGMLKTHNGRRNIAFTVFAAFIVCIILYHLIVQH